MNNIYLNYEASGMYACNNVRVADDIRIDIVEIVPGKSYTPVGCVEIVRFPSDLRSINIECVDAGYMMASAMMAESAAKADIIAKEMSLDNPSIRQPYIRTLKENDLYVIKSFQIAKNLRGKGYGSYALNKLPAALKRITNDRRPVIAVVPQVLNKSDDSERVIKFFEQNGYKKVDSCAQTLYYC